MQNWIDSLRSKIQSPDYDLEGQGVKVVSGSSNQGNKYQKKSSGSKYASSGSQYTSKQNGTNNQWMSSKSNQNAYGTGSGSQGQVKY